MIRLKQLRIEKNKNMRQTAITLDIPYTTYVSYEKGEREPNSETLIKFADYYNCSVDYLIGRTDERINDSVLDKALEIDNDILEKYGNLYEAKKAQIIRDNARTIEQNFNETVSRKEIEHITKYRTLDEYGKRTVDSVLDIEAERCQLKQSIYTFRRLSINKASAGLGFDLNDPDQWEEIQVIDTPEARNADMAVTVEGQSMEPDYYDGDIVYISLASEIPIGQVGLFVQNGKGYIKESGEDRIISRNPIYDDIYPSDGDIECKGLVIGKAILAK